MTPKRWIKATNAIGIISKQGRYNSGTFAHPDIAFEFASWLSPEFKLYLIKELEKLELIVSAFLDLAEARAKKYSNDNGRLVY